MAMTTIGIAQFGAYYAKLAVELPVAARKGLLDGALHCVRMLDTATKEKRAVSNGTLRMSWKAEICEGGARVYNTQLYAAVVEFGRRPGGAPPPLDVIVAWVRRKGLSGGGKSTPERKAARSIASASMSRAPRTTRARDAARIAGITAHANKIAHEGKKGIAHGDEYLEIAERIRWSIAAHGTPGRYIMTDIADAMRDTVARAVSKALDAYASAGGM